MVVCEKCGGDSEVKDSRPARGTVTRRRACTACGWRWTTYEVKREVFAELNRNSEAVKQVTEMVNKLNGKGHGRDSHKATA